MRQMRYILTNGIKRQAAVSGRVVSGPDIVDSGDSVVNHVFPDQGMVPLFDGNAEGVVL